MERRKMLDSGAVGREILSQDVIARLWRKVSYCACFVRNKYKAKDGLISHIRRELESQMESQHN
jgi:hypothetical protein